MSTHTVHRIFCDYCGLEISLAELVRIKKPVLNSKNYNRDVQYDYHERCAKKNVRDKT